MRTKKSKNWQKKRLRPLNKRDNNEIHLINDNI